MSRPSYMLCRGCQCDVSEIPRCGRLINQRPKRGGGVEATLAYWCLPCWTVMVDREMYARLEKRKVYVA